MNEVGSSDVIASRSNELGSRGMSTTSWEPSQVVFRTYVSRNPSGKKAQPLRVAVKKPLVVRLSKDLVETYRLCNPHFKYSGDLKPKRYLTSPSVGVLNDGKDNANSDLILAVNDVLFSSETQQRYIVKDLLGHGTFGQVAKCWIEETNGFVAVKIIKNQPAYYQQALVEVSILTTLNKKYDPEDKNHIVRIYDYFSHQRHLCICFELLDMNLYELIKINQFRGLSLSIVQLFSKQILRGLALLKDAGIIHCDLKPENILLCSSIKPLEIKIIDFGSACMEDRTVYSYIQSRYYRSPEVLLGYQYTTAIDMWSFGCIVAELFLGLPLFPGASEFDLLRRMIEILGEQPPDYVLKEAKNTSKFFKCMGSIQNLEHAEVSLDGRSAYQTLTEEEFAVREKNKPAMGKEYFHRMNLEAIVKSYPYRKNLAEEDIAKETQIRLALIDFLRGLVEFDPAKRWSPFQASKHPFITGEPFLSPYKPPPETPRIHVYPNIKVDHHPGGGHWFAAGLSPNLSGRSRVPIQNSPRFQMAPYSHANSYGSVGSYGSYNDANRLGSSYGSYGENGNMFPYYSPVNHSGINMHNRGGVSMLGSSPDARRRIMQYSHGSGLGASPSAGNFAPAALGSSPSQFTPPSSYNQVSAGSPGHYGPTSPARNSCHGSPLGKMAAFSQYNRRKSSGYSGSPHSQDSSSSQWQGLVVDGSNYHQNEEHSQIGTGSPSHLPSKSSFTNWNQQLGGTVVSAGPSTFAPNMYARPSIGPARENPDNGLLFPDPGDWDPNYSEESLLQEDNSDERTLAAAFGRGVHLGSADTIPSVGRPSQHSAIFLNPASQSVPNQAFSQGEIANLPTYDQYGRSSHFIPKSAHFLPPASQNFPSRLGQQPVQRFNNIRSNAGRGSDWYHGKSQRPPTNSNPGGERSPRSSSYSNSVPWGRRANHPMTNIPPASRGRMDFGSIA